MFAYNYLLACISLLGSVFAFKVFPALLATGLAIAVYLAAMEVCRNRTLAAISGFFAGFVPAMLRITTNSLSSHNLTLMLFVLSLYSLIRLEKTKQAFPWVILSSTLLALFSPFAMAFVVVLWVHMAMLKILGIKLQPKSFELMLFITFLVLVVNSIVMMQAGSGIVALLASLQPYAGYGMDWGGLLSGINVVVLILGIQGIYIALSKETGKREAAFFISTAIAVILLGLVGLLDLGLILGTIGVVLSITSVYSLNEIVKYVGKLRLASKHLLLIGLLTFAFALVVLQGVFEVFAADDSQAKAADIQGLLWLRNNSPSGSTVLAPLEYGHLITYFAQRRDMVDTNMINSGGTEQRLSDIGVVYTTKYETEAMKILDRYNVRYILFNQEIAAQFKSQGLSYSSDEDCFELVFNNSIEIYEVKCRLS